MARHYSHDAWNSILATIQLPVKGAVIGALAPVLAPSEAGERRSFMVAYPIMSRREATRQSATSEWAADMGDGLRAKAKVKQRTKARDEADKVRGLDRKLARGNALTRPYAVCTVTVPKTAAVTEYGRRLDAAIRSAGFAPLRLDLSQDARVRRLPWSPTRGISLHSSRRDRALHRLRADEAAYGQALRPEHRPGGPGMTRDPARPRP